MTGGVTSSPGWPGSGGVCRWCPIQTLRASWTPWGCQRDSRDSGKELMRQLSPEERLAYMMTSFWRMGPIWRSPAPRHPGRHPRRRETMHYLPPGGPVL